MVSSKYSLLGWLETDFLDGFLAEHQCPSADEDCGMSTKCILVGSIIMRHFHSSRCLGSASDCILLSNASFSFDGGLSSVYERRLLGGYYGSYHIEDEWKVLSEQIFHSYDEVHDFVGKLNTTSAASLEFLLFNPTFSLFISVSLLFEMTSLGTVVISSEILPVVIPGNHSFSLYVKILSNLIFFIFVLFMAKNQVWKMVKQKSRYWKQGWNYLSCVFILVYFTYLVFFMLYVATCEKIALKLINTELGSNINITEVAILETSLHVLIGTLLFVHVLRAVKVLSFSYRVKKMLKRLLNSQKQIPIAILAFLIIVLSCTFMIKYFIGTSSSFSHPLFGFVKVITSLFKNCEKPEIAIDNTPLGISIFTSLMLIGAHVYMFSIIRSILLNSDGNDASVAAKTVSFRATNDVIRRKFRACFKPGSPQTVTQIDCVPPIDFLLFELERLADLLVTKANALFPDKNDMDDLLRIECKLAFEKAKFELEELVASSLKANNFQLEISDSQERLISTIPRRSKGNLNSFMPSSFHASLASEKKSKTSETSTVSLQNRIRKTYPLSHLDSDSNSSETTSQPDEKLDSVSSLLLRRTKSRGKGKNEDFDLDIETSDQVIH